MAKPSTLLGWTGGTQTDPGATKRNTTGWAVGEKIPAQWLNWILGNVSSWIAYLDGLTGEALTWNAKHTFSGGLSSGVAAASANDLVRLNEVATNYTDIVVNAALNFNTNPGAAGRLRLAVQNGRSRLIGALASGASGYLSGSTTIFTLPVGSRPAVATRLPVVTRASVSDYNPWSVIANPDGTVVWYPGTGNWYVGNSQFIYFDCEIPTV